ncbi:MAG TPA: radical SAM protein [Minicystis sp.]|nr:radical SAM protein [Minicystis sp.]
MPRSLPQIAPSAEALAAALDARTAPSPLAAREDDERVRCLACAHRCALEDGARGICGVRFARGGELWAPRGYVARAYVRPVEINTVYHVLPGALALTFGMYGCDLRCPYCHNHNVSQALRDGGAGERPRDVTAKALVDEAVAAGCRVVVSAYNEPLVTAEWAREVFAEAKARGLVTAMISDGNATPEVLGYLRPVTDVFRVDLKGATQEQLRKLGGRLEPVLASIREARRLGYWVEVVTLVVPGLNDDAGSLRTIAREIVSIAPDVPWHLNGFYPRYRMKDRRPTPAGLLFDAAATAYALGLSFVYVGNVEDQLAELCHTRCPRCHETLVRRAAYATVENRVARGACGACGEIVPGLWGGPAE